MKTNTAIARPNYEISFDDRLSQILKFANELSNCRLREIKIRYDNRWNKAVRREKSLSIQHHKPWRKSSGPKTAAGKARSAQNANKGKSWTRSYQALRMAMRDLARLVRRIRTLIKLGMEGKTLLARLFATDAKDITTRLRTAFLAVYREECNRAQQSVI